MCAYRKSNNLTGDTMNNFFIYEFEIDHFIGYCKAMSKIKMNFIILFYPEYCHY